MTALGELLGVPYGWTASRKYKDKDLCQDIGFQTWWSELPQICRDAFEWKSGLKEFTTDDQVHKQLILPTPNNLELIGKNYVFLHRNPDEIIQAHARGKRVVVPDPSKAVRELEHVAHLHIDNMPSLVVDFQTLIINPKKVVIKILEAWGMTAKFPRGWEFPQERRSGFTPRAGTHKASLHFIENK